MSEGINIVITISGDPSSGKTTTVEELKMYYEMLGFKVELKFIGKESRPRILNEYRKYLEQHPEIRKKDSITIEDAHADPVFSTIIRQEIDSWIDEDTRKYGEEINSIYTPNVVYIIDGRLAWKQIPNSFAVRTTIDPNVAGERAFNDTSRGFKSKKEATEATLERTNGERDRYKIRYGIDLTDESHYNLVIDTTHLTVADVTKRIIKGEIKFRESKYKALREGQKSIQHPQKDDSDCR